MRKRHSTRSTRQYWFATSIEGCTRSVHLSFPTALCKQPKPNACPRRFVIWAHSSRLPCFTLLHRCNWDDEGSSPILMLKYWHWCLHTRILVYVWMCKGPCKLQEFHARLNDRPDALAEWRSQKPNLIPTGEKLGKILPTWWFNGWNVITYTES